MYDKLWLIPFIPLVGAVINGLLGKKVLKSEKVIGAIGVCQVFRVHLDLTFIFELT